MALLGCELEETPATSGHIRVLAGTYAALGLAAWVWLKGLESTQQWLYSLLHPAAIAALLVVAVKTCTASLAQSVPSTLQTLLCVVILAWMRENSLLKWRQSEKTSIDCGYCACLVAVMLPYQAETLSLESTGGVLALVLLAQGLLVIVLFIQSLVMSTIAQSQCAECKPLQGPKPATYL